MLQNFITYVHALGLKNSGSFKNNLHGIKLSVFHSIEDFLSFFKKNDKNLIYVQKGKNNNVYSCQKTYKV